MRWRSIYIGFHYMQYLCMCIFANKVANTFELCICTLHDNKDSSCDANDCIHVLIVISIT